MSAAPSPSDSERTPTVADAERGGSLRGARWIARSTPERLLRVALEFLRDAGFDVRGGGSAQELDAHSAEWIATAVERDDDARPRKRWWASIVSGEQTPRSTPRIEHARSSMLVVAAARPVTTGVAELVVFPYASSRVGGSRAADAASRSDAVLTRITAAAGGEGAMLSHESLAVLPDDSAPLPRIVLRDVLDWC